MKIQRKGAGEPSQKSWSERRLQRLLREGFSRSAFLQRVRQVAGKDKHRPGKSVQLFPPGRKGTLAACECLHQPVEDFFGLIDDFKQRASEVKPGTWSVALGEFRSQNFCVGLPVSSLYWKNVSSFLLYDVSVDVLVISTVNLSRTNYFATSLP